MRRNDEAKKVSVIAFLEDDGGRARAGYKGHAGDCVVRAIAIATQQGYQAVYDELFQLNKLTRSGKRGDSTTPRDGNTSKKTIRKYMEGLGWVWTPTMGIGTGCTIHLSASELPPGRLVVSLSKHLAAVVDGVLHDTHDCSRKGTRCVYGYWTIPGLNNDSA